MGNTQSTLYITNMKCTINKNVSHSLSNNANIKTNIGTYNNASLLTILRNATNLPNNCLALIMGMGMECYEWSLVLYHKYEHDKWYYNDTNDEPKMYNPRHDYNTIKTIITHYPQLVPYYLWDSYFTDNAIMKILSNISCHNLIRLDISHCQHVWFKMKMLYLGNEIERRGLYKLLLAPIKNPIIHNDAILIILMVPNYVINEIKLWAKLLEGKNFVPLLGDYGLFKYDQPTTKTIYSLIDNPLPKTIYRLYFYYVSGYENEALAMRGKLGYYAYS